jgi:hypothetical protein
VSPLLYVYAIVPAIAPARRTLDRATLQGIDGGLLHGVDAADLTAAVSDVAPADFEAEPLNRLVRQVDWLAPRAALHQQVNATLFGLTDAMIPLAFGTIYRDRAGIVTMLESEHQKLLSCLDRVGGKGEWVMSLQRQAETALATVDQHNPAVRDLRERIATGPPGRAYLLSRQIEAVRRRELLLQDGQAVAALDALAPGVEDAVTEPLDAGAENGLLARVSVLVRREQEPDWLAALEGYRQRWSDLGYDLRVTGPWPPYRFSRSALELLSAGR